MSYSFTELLIASEAHPDIPSDMDLFGQFVGQWDMEVEFFDREGNRVFAGPGLWSFAWILDGRGIQDVLMYELPEEYPASPGVRRIGTSLRSYHAADRSWRVTWFGATADIYLSLKARSTEYGISISGADVDGSPLEWVFSDITPHSFEWMGRTASGGGPWWTEQTMIGRRRA